MAVVPWSKAYFSSFHEKYPKKVKSKSYTNFLSQSSWHELVEDPSADLQRQEAWITALVKPLLTRR